MSKYLKSGSTGRYTRSEQISDSKYARATQIHHAQNLNSDTTASADELQQSTPIANTVEYTEYDQQQFTSLADFPGQTYRGKQTEHGIWASCQFTDQDDAGFMQLQQELSAFADSNQ